jgi:hypothetical protein
MEKAPDELDERISTFVQWFRENGGYMHPSLVLAADGDGAFVHVRAGAENIVHGTMLLRCPQSLTLSCVNAITSQEPLDDDNDGGGAGLSLFKAFFQKASPPVVAVFVLCEQYLLGRASFWWPYIRLLPQPGERDKLGTPLWFSERDRRWLRGTNVWHGVQERFDDWREKWADGVRMLREAGWDTDAFSWCV